MTTRPLASLLACATCATLAALTFGSSAARADDERAAASSAKEKARTSDFIRLVRRSTERFQNVSAALAEDYELMFGCVTGGDWGAMGLHYVNMKLVADGKLDPTRPEIVIYEPLPNGRLRLIGADYLLFAKDWDLEKEKAPPQLGGQLLHFFESPNRFGLPEFYTLHVWAWKDNPTGPFVNWHANVSCKDFDTHSH